MKVLLSTVIVCLLTIQIDMFAGISLFAAPNPSKQGSGDSTLSTHESNLVSIFSALDNRITDHSLLEKVKNKVFTLSDQQTRLVASLSNQVLKDRGSTTGDIAFLLLTALIVLF